MFITEEDYHIVIGEIALKVVSQVSEDNRRGAAKRWRRSPVTYAPSMMWHASSLRKVPTETGSSSCMLAISRFTTCPPPCLKRWVWTSARSDTSVLSNGLRGYKQAGLFPTCLLQGRKTAAKREVRSYIIHNGR